jgi:transcriptional regulator with XRE-family HTH domain
MRLLRAQKGLTQEALAFQSGINRTYLSAVERSERNVSLDNVARIAKGLEVEAWTLLRGDETTSKVKSRKPTGSLRK